MTKNHISQISKIYDKSMTVETWFICSTIFSKSYIDYFFTLKQFLLPRV